MKPSYTSIGCYPLLYLTTDDYVLCHQCATDEEEEGFRESTPHVNWEDCCLYCDECSDRIESAYAEEEEEEEAEEEEEEAEEEEEEEEEGVTWQVCNICRVYISNDDASSLDYFYDQKTSDRIFETMKHNLETEPGYAIVTTRLDEDYHRKPCQCCSVSLDPIRYQVVFQE